LDNQRKGIRESFLTRTQKKGGIFYALARIVTRSSLLDARLHEALHRSAVQEEAA
jgi:hypothetical protein